MNATIKARLTAKGSDFEVEVQGGEVKVYIREPGTHFGARYSSSTDVARVGRAVEELSQALAAIEHSFGRSAGVVAKAEPGPDFVDLARRSLELLEFHDQEGDLARALREGDLAVGLAPDDLALRAMLARLYLLRSTARKAARDPGAAMTVFHEVWRDVLHAFREGPDGAEAMHQRRADLLLQRL